MKYINILLFILTVLITNSVKSLEIKILASINDTIITNYDFYKEKINFELINQTKITVSQENNFLQNIIEEKIKILEIESEKININEKLAIAKFNEIKRERFNNINLSKENEEYALDKIKRKMQWNSLIFKKYKNKLSINMNEINKILTNENFTKMSKEKIVEIEKNKKLNIISKTHFNQIKRKYFIKIY